VPSVTIVPAESVTTWPMVVSWFDVEKQRVSGESRPPEDEFLFGDPNCTTMEASHFGLENREQEHAMGNRPTKPGLGGEFGIDVDWVVISGQPGELVKLGLGEDGGDLRHDNMFEKMATKHKQ